MANRDCNGTYFSVAGVRLYWCLWDGATMLAPTTEKPVCPNCKRAIDAVGELGDVKTRLVREADLGQKGWVRLPPLPQPGDEAARTGQEKPTRRCVVCDGTEGFTSPLNLCATCEEAMKRDQEKISTEVPK